MGDSRRTFGPVPSRRLGRSLGINNIPAKVCSYSCVYCQLGRTTCLLAERRGFFEPASIFEDVQARLTSTGNPPEVDYLTFVADGEPTLDRDLGREIDLLKTLAVPVAVITNGSLLDRDEVQEELCRADWVSVKIDAAEESLWRRINRPHSSLQLKPILDGMRAFAGRFAGTLTTETMILKGLNDEEDAVEATADFIRLLRPDAAYLSIPTRPPAEKVGVPKQEALLRAYELFADKIEHAEYLIDYEGDSFASSGDAERDLLEITAVHPMRAEAVRALLSRTGSPWSIVDQLAARGELAAVRYRGDTFYVRRFSNGRAT